MASLLKTVRSGGPRYMVVTAHNDRGVLYGAFALLRKIALGEPVADLDERHTPYDPVRWINQWDNLDGSIERGYGGRSIFWENQLAREDLSRVSDYGRLLASLGINGCSINNVNVNPRILAPDFLPQVARIAEAFRPWGVRVVLSVDFGSPKTIGGLDTFDPLDPRVAGWWKSKVDEIYRAIPDLAGLLIKADSEGRVGPSAYGRTHADAANVVARALEPHGGLILYRGFVYDHRMDWRNLKNDRARAADDNFKDLDGKFDDNVVIQIKNGPIDFQVREPASPLFGTLEKTNQAIELQITQEYFGQARHTVFLVPYWKDTLDFDMHARGAGTPVKALAAGKTFHRPVGGAVGVANVGLDENWTGNHLSQANLYGFGRLAWNPDLSAETIADEWTRLTFGNDPRVVSTVKAIQLSSWRTYENYTGPLGLQTLTDIVGNHYGVAVEASERNGWGQWHRADETGVGMDRTVATGTGFIGQYRPEVAHVFESLSTCPDDLLLFLHHVPYSYKLHSGKTVVQYIYDSHYAGAEAVEGYARQWNALKVAVDEQRYAEVLAQLEYQAGQATVWRDAVANWFRRASGIADAQGRVGRYPGRTEAEAMTPGRLQRARRDAMGRRFRRQGNRVRHRALQSRDALRRRARLVHRARRVFRPEQRRIALPALCGQPVGGRVDRRRKNSHAPHGQFVLHAPEHRRNRPAPRRRDPHRGRPGWRRAGGAGLYRAGAERVLTGGSLPCRTKEDWDLHYQSRPGTEMRETQCT